MKRSEASTREKRLESILLVLDENLSGHSIVDSLKAKGLPVRSQLKYVPRGADDYEVASCLGQHPDLVLVTKDRDLRYKQQLVAKLMEAGIRVFVLSAMGNKQAQDIVEHVAKGWPAMRRFLKKHAGPFVAHVYADGGISMHHKPSSAPT